MVHMTQPTTTTGTKVTYAKRQAGGWYVAIDGERIGWTVNIDGEGWAFYAATKPGLIADRLAWGHSTRWDATYDGIGSLRIYHLGRLYRLNIETLTDEAYYINEGTLRDAATAVLDARYGA